MRRLVALWLLLGSALVGCRAAPAVRHPVVGGLEDLRDISTEPQAPPADLEEVKLAAHELPAVPPVPADARESAPLPGPDLDEQLSERALTLAELEAIAFRSNPTLAAAAARLEAARGQQVQAGLYPNPDIGYNGAEIGNQGTAGGQGAFVRQEFVTAGKLQLDQAVAGKEVAATHFELHAQEQRVLSDVRVRFYQALVAQRRVDLTEELVEIGENLVEATQSLLENRQSTENDLLQAEIRAENARILYDNACNESVEAWRRLAAVIGLPHLPLEPLIGELDAETASYDWDACYAMLLSSNPELNAARARVDRARIAIERATREPIPNVDVFVSGMHQNMTDSEIAHVQVGVPLPVFDKNQGNIRSAEAALVAASKEVERIGLALQDRFAVAFRRYANARQQAERYSERIVPKAKRSLDLVTEGYEQGQADYLTLLTAQQTYVEVSLSYLEALQELRTSAAVIDGQLLTDSLSSPVAVMSR